MTSNIYEGLLGYSRTCKLKFRSLLATGNFGFEGRSNYKTRLLVVTVGNGNNIISSHIPQQWLAIIDEPRENIDDDIEQKAKRGPGVKDFQNERSAKAASKEVTETVIGDINSALLNYSVQKKNQMIECIIGSVRKQFDIHNEKEVDANNNSEVNNKIVFTLREYLSGLSKHGGKYSQEEATIETILSAVSVETLSNNVVATTLEVTKTRMSAARKRRKIFDSVII